MPDWDVNGDLTNCERLYDIACRELTKVMAQRDELLKALNGVIRVADRKTVEFDAARAAVAKAEGK
jgi:hypothetical protein